MEKTKDYWYLAYRSFFALFFLAILIFLFILFQGSLVAKIAMGGVTFIWFLIAYFLKQRNKWGLYLGYTISFLAIGGALVGNVRTLSLDITSLLMYVVYSYLIWILYKAQKQS